MAAQGIGDGMVKKHCIHLLHGELKRAGDGEGSEVQGPCYFK